MSESIRTPKASRRARGEFWRACSFLIPYKRDVVIAMISAIVSRFLFAIGLTAMYPIISVLVPQQDKNGNPLPTQSVGEMMHQKLLAAQARGSSGTYYRIGEHFAQYLPSRPILLIGAMFLVILALGLIGNLFKFCHEYLSDKSAISAINDIRNRLYDRILHLSLPYFGKHGTSDVTSRLVSDAQNLQDGFKTVLSEAIAEPVSSIVDSVIACLGEAPPELAHDLIVRGMHLVGGGGMLRGLAHRLAEETEIPVTLVDQPLEAVVLGAGRCIEAYDQLRVMFMGQR